MGQRGQLSPVVVVGALVICGVLLAAKLQTGKAEVPGGAPIPAPESIEADQAPSARQPETRFGLAEGERRTIVKELLACEDVGADAETCDPKVAKRHGISREVLAKIKIESAEKNWPMSDR